MITPTNLAKNVISPNSLRKGGYAFWGDDVVTWGDALYKWGSPSATTVNLTKNTITPTNQVKN